MFEDKHAKQLLCTHVPGRGHEVERAVIEQRGGVHGGQLDVRTRPELQGVGLGRADAAAAARRVARRQRRLRLRQLLPNEQIRVQKDVPWNHTVLGIAGLILLARCKMMNSVLNMMNFV